MLTILRTLFVLLLLSFSLSTVAQNQREAPPNERSRPTDFTEKENLQDWLETQDDDARRENLATPRLEPPEIVPSGWLHDFDYQTDLVQYLQHKYQNAAAGGRTTYVYLYADWDEACKSFRKSAGGKDYQKLFASNQIVMVEYVYVKRKFGARFKKLPVFVKVHPTGFMGPESLRPMASINDHPRKAFHKVRKFFAATAAR